MKRKKKEEFSKWLLRQESALIWIETIAFLGLAYIAIIKGYTASLPWLTSLSALPWTAYATSQAFYYKKSEKENTKDGIVYDTAMKEIETSPKDDDIYYGI